jgi:organic radical activating enzyme
MKPVLDYVEFHITNVCNFNCDGCSRYTNYYFSGQQLWNDYKDTYRKWNDLIDIEEITILGGEPLLNPDIIKWIDGIASIWQNTKIRIVTNGTHINKVPGLYDVLKKYNGRVSIEVGLHNKDRRQLVIDECKQFLNTNALEYFDYSDRYNEWQGSYNAIKDSNWPVCDSPADFCNLPKNIQEECITVHNFSPLLHSGVSMLMIDNNNVEIDIRNEFEFGTIGLTRNSNVFSLCNSDPSLAHNVCNQSHCHQFVKGNLYKCPTSALLPEFIEQFRVDISPEHTEIINSYKPLTVNNTEQEISTFINNIKKVIPQCKFCPVTIVESITNATTNKVRVKKKKT